MAGTGITALIAALLSNASYPGNSPPSGWTAIKTVTSGPDSFTVFQNSSTSQIVIGFKGSDNYTNYYNDITDSGYPE